jgi:hypothetical protein
MVVRMSDTFTALAPEYATLMAAMQITRLEECQETAARFSQSLISNRHDIAGL